MTCATCGYLWQDINDKYPRCHYEGPDAWAPCAQDEEYIEDED
jgi:hypothetical protein